VKTGFYHIFLSFLLVLTVFETPPLIFAEPIGVTTKFEASTDTETTEEEKIDDLLDFGALEEEINLLSDVWVVTGTKEKRRSIDSPFTVFTLDNKAIEALCPTNITDILRAIPGFDTFRIKPGAINASEPGTATQYGAQYLVLIDGVAFGNKRGRSADWATLPIQIDEIERVEYLPGAQSTLYGSYAAVGVVNIITKRVTPALWDDEKPSSLRIRTGSDGLGIYDLSYNAKEKNLTSSVWGSFSTIDKHDDAVNYGAPAFANQGESTYKQGGFSLKNDFDENRNLRLDFSYLRGDRSPYLHISEDPDKEDLQENSIVATYTEDYGNSNNFTFMLKNRDNNATNSDNTSGVDFSDFQVEARKQFVDSGNRIITIGGYYQELSLEGNIYGNEAANLYESSVNTLVEQPLKDDQSIFIGLNGYHSSYTGSDLSYKLFYKKKTQDNEAFRVGYSTSVRGPDIVFSKMEDLIVNFPPPTGPARLLGGNPDLENEEFSFAEVSYEKHTTNSNLISRFYVGKSKNRIIAIDDLANPINIFGNIIYPQLFVNDEEDSDQLGLTTTWDRTLGEKWRSTLTWRYLHATDGTGATTEYSPKHVINFMAAFNVSNKLNLTLFSKTSTSYVVNNSDTSALPASGYTKLDFAARFKMTKDSSQQLWLRIDNITDRKVVESYGNGGEFAPGWEIGRMFTAGYSIRF